MLAAMNRLVTMTLINKPTFVRDDEYFTFFSSKREKNQIKKQIFLQTPSLLLIDRFPSMRQYSAFMGEEGRLQLSIVLVT